MAPGYAAPAVAAGWGPLGQVCISIVLLIMFICRHSLLIAAPSTPCLNEQAVHHVPPAAFGLVLKA